MLSRRLLLPRAARNATLGAAGGGRRVVAGGGTGAAAAAAAAGVGSLQSWHSPLRYYTQDSGQLMGSRRFVPSDTKIKTTADFKKIRDLKEACARRDFAAALTLLQEQHGGAKEYAYLIGACLKAHEWNRAEKIFENLLAREDKIAMENIRPNAVQLLNQIMRNHMQHVRSYRNWNLFHKVTKEAPPSSHERRRAIPRISSSIERIPPNQRIMPNADSYSLLLRGCASSQKGREAVELVDGATSFGIALSEWSMKWAAFACSRAGNTKDAWQILRSMDQQRMVLTQEEFGPLLSAKALLGGNCDEVFELMERLGCHPSVRSFSAAHMYRQALVSYDSHGQEKRDAEDYYAALAAGGKLQDAAKVTGILEDMERADVFFASSVIPNSSRVFYEVDADADDEEEDQGPVAAGEQRQGSPEEEERCLDAIVRVNREKGLNLTPINLVRGLERYGRGHEVDDLSARWMSVRLDGMGPIEEPDEKKRKQLLKERTDKLLVRMNDYASTMNGLAVRGEWPKVMYLFEETLLLTKGSTPVGPVLLRAVMGSLTREENKAKRNGDENQAELMHELALSAYRQGLNRGWVSHMSSHQAGKMDVHRFSADRALLAVETYLRDEAFKMMKGGADVNKDLCIITGRGKHAPIVYPAAPLAFNGKVEWSGPLRKGQTLSGSSSGESPVMKLRNKLARLLAEKYALFSPTELANLDDSRGRLVISREKKMKWINDYIAQNPSLSSRPPLALAHTSKKKAPERGGSAAKHKRSHK